MSDAWQDGYGKATDEFSDRIGELEDQLKEAKGEIERLRNNLDNVDSALYDFEKEGEQWEQPRALA